MIHGQMRRLAAALATIAALGCGAALAADASADAAAAPATAAPATPAEALAILKNAKAPLTAEELSAIEGVLKPAAASQPKDAQWAYGLALIERARMGQSKEAAERRTHALAWWDLMKKAVALDEKNPDMQLDLGNATMSSLGPDDGFMTMASRAGDAKDAWEAGIEADPNHVPCLAALGMYEVQARKQGGWLFGSYSKARGYAERLLKLPEGQFQGYMVLASADAAEEEWDEMSKHYAQAEAAPGLGASPTQAMYAQANVLLNFKKDAKAAMPVIERLVAKAGPEDYTVRYLRGAARKLEGDCQGAMEDFRAVLEKNPAAQNTRFLMAECCESTGDLQGAAMHYQEFLVRFPQDKRAEAAKKAVDKIQKSAK